MPPADASVRAATKLPAGRAGDPEEDNPFAPPPEGRPDQPWQPRYPSGGPAAGNGGAAGQWGNGGGAGRGGRGVGGDHGGRPHGDGYGAGGRPPGAGHESRGDGDRGEGTHGNAPGAGAGDDGQAGGGPEREPGSDQRSDQPLWGSQWSSRQPGRHDGGFGSGFGTGPGGEQPSRPDERRSEPPRWDPSDPVQRRARYALLAGMWGFFFALFSIQQIALLLSALAVYWGISSLRGTARTPVSAPDSAADGAGSADRAGASGSSGVSPDAPPPPPGATAAPLPPPGAGSPQPGQKRKPQAPAAISGLVTGGLALAIVLVTFTFQIVYRDYYTCTNDALTHVSQHSCQRLLPSELRPVLGNGD